MLIRNIIPVNVCQAKLKTNVSRVAKKVEPKIKKGTEKISDGKKNFFQKIKNFFTKISNVFKEKLIKINKADIKRLSKLQPQEFLEESQKIIAKSKNYDYDTMAIMMLQPLGNKKIAMLYDASSNVIYINTDNKIKSGAMLFSSLAHEYEHMRQNMQILRTKGLGAKAIEAYSDIQAKNNINVFSQVYQNLKKEDLPALKEQFGENYEFVEGFVNAKDEGAQALNVWIKNAIDKEKLTIKTKWLEIQTKIIKKYGDIAENTKEAERSKEYFDGFFQEGSLVGLKKMSTRNEVEAYLSTFINYYNYILRKLF